MLDNITCIWLIRLRWCALAFGLYAFYGNHSSVLIGCGIALLISNLVASKALTKKTIPAILLIDILLLTLVLSVTGGPANPFSVLYLVHITLTAAVLGANWTWIIACVSVAAFGSLFLFDTASHAHHGSFSDHLKGMWIAFALASALITYFVSKILTELKEKELEMLDMRLELEKNSKFASLVTLSAGAAHELGTPLSTIALITSELARTNNQEIKEDVKILESEVQRCKNILEEMRTQADLASTEQWQLVSHEEIKQKISQEIQLTSLPNPCYLPIFSLAKTLKLLISNAKDAKAESILLSAKLENSFINFEVKDTGTGMAQTILDRATEPFFTTKTKGMGLGLFLARVFCEQLGGRLNIESTPYQGSTVSVIFPAKTKLRIANE